MKNKRVKQMIVDVTLQGRKAIWYGDETEIYAAKSLSQLEEEYGEVEEFPDEKGNIVSKDWRYWWKPCVSEKAVILKTGKTITKGALVHKNGSNCIQWTGSNLAEVLKFTGKAQRFNEWFMNFDHFKNYVEASGNTFKLFEGDRCVGVAKVGDYIIRKGELNHVVTKDRIDSTNMNFERLPLICGVYGGANDIAMVLTSYN